ncbi:MAG TPA: retron St85 family RNA-directed DNA polymerase [Drouetiella sp.]|jgi:RNA-directed DNA polymerase
MTLNSKDSLARALEMSEFELSKYIFRADYLYKRFSVPKKSGGQRHISAPSRELKRIQKWISHNLLKPLPVHDACTGYRVGMCIVDNARPHVGQDFVLNADIEDFFPSITIDRVNEFFESIGYDQKLAGYLARLCTHDQLLPQGAPTSPDLANLICNSLDERLSRFCAEKNWNYTRYCDDITVSGSGHITRSDIDTISNIIASEGFKVNDKKLRVARKTSQQKVTGLVVNERVNLPRRERRRVRAMIHRQETTGVASKSTCSKIHGHIAFARMVAKASDSGE